MVLMPRGVAVVLPVFYFLQIHAIFVFVGIPHRSSRLTIFVFTRALFTPPAARS